MAWEFLAVRFFHLIFIAWGVGGVTVAALLMKKGEKEPSLMPSVMRLLEPISKLIWIAMIGLVATGLATTALGAGKGYYDTTILLAKHIAVAIIFIGGLNITFRLLPKLKKLSPAPGTKPTPEFLKTGGRLKLASTISLIMWYLVVVLSVAM